MSLRNGTLVTFHLTVTLCHRCSLVTSPTLLALAVPDTAALLPGSARGLITITILTQQSASACLWLGLPAVCAPHTGGISVWVWTGGVCDIDLVHLRGRGRLCHRVNKQCLHVPADMSGYHRAARHALRAVHFARSEQIHAAHLLHAVAHLSKVVLPQASVIQQKPYAFWVHISSRSELRHSPGAVLHSLVEVCVRAAGGALVHAAERRRHRIQAQGHDHCLAELCSRRARTGVRGVQPIPLIRQKRV